MQLIHSILERHIGQTRCNGEVSQEVREGFAAVNSVLTSLLQRDRMLVSSEDSIDSMHDVVTSSDANVSDNSHTRVSPFSASKSKFSKLRRLPSKVCTLSSSKERLVCAASGAESFCGCSVERFTTLGTHGPVHWSHP